MTPKAIVAELLASLTESEGGQVVVSNDLLREARLFAESEGAEPTHTAATIRELAEGIARSSKAAGERGLRADDVEAFLRSGLSTPTPATIRELAKEILGWAESITGRNLDKSGYMDQWTRRVARFAGDLALPDLASLLGEVGVVHGVIDELESRADLYGKGEPGDGDWRKARNGGLSAGSRDAAGLLRSALPGDAGRRAGEVLRAAAAYDAAVEDEAEHSLAAHRRVTHYTESGDMPRPDGEWRRSEERLEQAQDALLESVRALLAAFPGLLREVEGGDDWRRRDFAVKAGTGTRGLLEVAEPRRREAPDGE